jgi:dihydroflavonol-4-reductase
VSGSVFVTGGSGFIGGALITRLVRDGRDVRALARSDAAAQAVTFLGATAIDGDLHDQVALLRGMRGCRTVFHVAGVNAMCLRDTTPMFESNVDGATSVVRAASAAGVSRVVHTSSAATIGELEGTIGREDTPHRGSFLSAYERSKYEGERAVLSLSDELGVVVVCVNPSSVQGPGRMGGSARLLLDLVNDALPVLVDTIVSIIDIDDCVEALVLAEHGGVPGSRYLVSGATLSIRAAVDLLRDACGRPRHARFVSRSLVRTGSPLVPAAARIVRRDSALCAEMIRTLLHGHRYDGSLATTELGLRYTPVEDTVRRTLSWYAERDMAPAPLQRGGSDRERRA